MSKLAKFLRLEPFDRRLLIEASLLLLVARGALRVLPFRTVVGVINRAAPATSLDAAAAAALVRRVRWAVRSGARNGPGRAVCFPQGIAAHLMLSRRGAPSTLYYGVAKTRDGRARVACLGARRIAARRRLRRRAALHRPDQLSARPLRAGLGNMP